MDKQKGAFMQGIDKMVIREIDIPKIKDGQVLVQ